LLRAREQKLQCERGFSATGGALKQTHPIAGKPAPKNRIELGNP
jgi:hypothetical protein